MGDKVAGQEEKHDGASQTTQSPTPALPEKKEAAQSDTDPASHSGSSSEQIAKKTVWKRFWAWVWPMEFSDAVMILLTVFIALGTVMSAVAIGFQWWEMHIGGKDTTRIADAAEKQRDAGQQFSTAASGINDGVGNAVKKLDTQARATQGAANVASETLMAEIRTRIPHVDVVEFKVIGLDEGAKNYVVTQQWKNFGQTRAIKVHLEWTIGKKPFDMPLNQDKRYKFWTAFQQIDLAENYSGRVDRQLIPVEVLDQASGDNGPIYLYGWSTYEDVFGGKNPRHYTEFCYHPNRFDKNKLTIDGSPCENHNCSDESCKPN